MRNIIIEGADGSGKSTLAKILAEKYGMTIFHSGGQKELKNVDEYFEMFKSSENMICISSKISLVNTILRYLATKTKCT